MTRKSSSRKSRSGRRICSDELKSEAVQMLLDGHSAESVVSNLGLSGASLLYSPNLLINAPPPDGINQIWVGDITYVPLVGGDFLYLAMLMDRFSRRIVGWDLQDHVRETLVISIREGITAAFTVGPLCSSNAAGRNRIRAAWSA